MLNYPDDLHWGKIKIWRKSICEWIPGPGFPISRILCAGNDKKYGIRTCFGDSGGPLACIHNDKMVLAGITSYTADYCKAEYGSIKFRLPSFFTRVSHFVDWIENYTVSHFKLRLKSRVPNRL